MIYLQLFLTYFKIGLFTIGGGYAMIPLIQQEVVISHQWMTMTELTDFIAVAESTPGPFAINSATFVGMKMAGVPGAILTTTGVVLPSLIIIMLIARWFANFQDNRWVKGALSGMSPVVLGLIASAVFLLLEENFASLSAAGLAIDMKAVLTTILCGVLYFKFKLHPIALILCAAALGIVLYGLVPAALTMTISL
ncbi:MAG: chromate transporter [Eubacterium sp.]|nr:chromate transporter [Eubacterium sp.]